jgi:hypothetical protein
MRRDAQELGLPATVRSPPRSTTQGGALHADVGLGLGWSVPNGCSALKLDLPATMATAV